MGVAVDIQNRKRGSVGIAFGARLAATGSLLFAAIACGEDAPTTPTSSAVGVYKLESVNDTTVPFLFEVSQGTSGRAHHYISSGSVVLRRDSTSQLITVIRLEFDNGSRDSAIYKDNGRWTATERTVELHSPLSNIPQVLTRDRGSLILAGVQRRLRYTR